MNFFLLYFDRHFISCICVKIIACFTILVSMALTISLLPSIRNATTLVNGRIILNENSREDTMALEKYAFSNALALSGKSHLL